MIRIENPLGIIEISQNYFSNLIGNAASSCYGVAEMANTNAVQGVKSFLKKRNFNDKGVSVRNCEGKLLVDLHIIISYGINIPAIVSSIVNKVTYIIENATGLQVKKVNVYVDGMKPE